MTKEYDRDVLPDTDFLFTVTLAEPDVDSYKYKIYDADGGVVTEGTLAAADKKVFTVRLKAGQYAVIPGMPVCGYSVVETVSIADYKPGYAVYVSDTGGEIVLDVTLEVPITMGNDFQNQLGYIDWEFKVEELPVEPSDPDLPETGDDFSLYFYLGILVLCVLAVIFLLFAAKKRLREEQAE